ncbi:hypothetical protein JX266_009854 [Neoarthrinium moseri]|uniref:uncharacterized protein n=1 Tax=Neoarthrinium moseri TaxID=1658444 RepID=UPI001FDBEFA1|nr:uncharacterized protein JN550_011634 [Neoarthrinium moseri]KAI1843988.1 hypothetical protein JX266_009854 [Neoarthrinium moseri]KAI1860256.1 hypothetical protein JN550_011634 [Neoarthrinium moseri]
MADTGSSRVELEPPDYDSLSIAPPYVDVDTSSQQPGESSRHAPLPETRKKSWMEKLKEMRIEDEKRKKERIQYVTPQEADRITGLQRRREEEKYQRGNPTLVAWLLS